MSRIGSMPVIVPDTVDVSIQDGEVLIKSSHGSISHKVPACLNCIYEDRKLSISMCSGLKDKGTGLRKNLSSWGMFRSIVNSSIIGLSGKKFVSVIKLNGVGYKVALDKSSKYLIFALGYSHDIAIYIPQGISVECPDAVSIKISGINKEVVFGFSASLKKLRKVEPYKGKGVFGENDFILRKSGKKK